MDGVHAPLLGSSNSSSASSDLFEDDQPNRVVQARPTIREVVSRQSAINLAVYTFLALHSVSFDQLTTIFMHLPKQVPDKDNTSLPFKFSGGFGLGSDRIGTLFTM